MANILEHRTYKRIAEQNLEFIRSDIWDIEIVKWPLAVYNPGEEIFKSRLKSVSPGTSMEVVAITKSIHTHDLTQPVGRGDTAGTATFTFEDREDQAITFMIQDMLDKIADADTGFGRHKTELIFEFNLVFYNTLLEKIRKIEFYGGTFSGCTLPDDTGERGSDLSAVTMSIKYEHYKRFFLNY